VAFNGLGGAVSAFVPPAAPWIMYGSPVFTNAINWFGDGSKQTVFNGSIPINQYLINTAIDEMSLYLTNVVKTGLATPSKDIWNPGNHTKYFSKEILGKEISGRSIEDVIQQGVASWTDYSMKASLYPRFNPDKLNKDGKTIPLQNYNIFNSPIISQYKSVYTRYQKNEGGNNIIENYLQLRRSIVR
jgi:hypothetical protein